MRAFERRMPWIAGLLLAGAAVAPAPILAQEVPPERIDCGPVRIGVGDLVSLNVGNADRAPQEPVVLQARLLDADGGPLLELVLTLAPGQSRSATLRSAEGGLVRAEVVPTSGPQDARLKATVQVQQQRRLRLTYGPTFECAGPTASRGPV